jgi:hypothetical protein
MDIAALKKEAKNKKTLPTRLLELAKNADPTVQYAVASNPNAPLLALEYLSGHGKWTILKAVAGNPNVSTAILEKLAGKTQPTVVEAVAKSTSAPATLLETLTKHPELSVRLALTENQSLTPYLYELLSQDPDSQVVLWAALRVDCPASVLTKLATNVDDLIRGAVASAYNTPLEVRLELTKDPVKRVRSQAVNFIKTH